MNPASPAVDATERLDHETHVAILCVPGEASFTGALFGPLAEARALPERSGARLRGDIHPVAPHDRRRDAGAGETRLPCDVLGVGPRSGNRVSLDTPVAVGPRQFGHFSAETPRPRVNTTARVAPAVTSAWLML